MKRLVFSLLCHVMLWWANWLTDPLMKSTHCPMCYEPLEIREVSPCMDCGHDPAEVQHCLERRHTYAECRIFGELSLVLCNFCQVDFSSYDPAYFGLPPGKSTGMGGRDWQLIREVSSTVAKDKCCATCGHRLPFLEFVLQARELHAMS